MGGKKWDNCNSIINQIYFKKFKKRKKKQKIASADEDVEKSESF